AVSIIAFVASNYIATSVYKNPSIVVDLQLASLMAFITVIFNLTLAVLVALDRVFEAALANVLYVVVQFIGIIAFIYLGYGVLGSILGLLAGLLFGVALELYYLLSDIDYKIIRPTRKIMKELTSFSLPVVISQIATIGAANFAILLLGVYVAS